MNFKIAALTLLFVFIFFTPVQAEPEGALKLKVGVEEFSPFIIKEKKQYKGFEIELWEAIAKELDLPFEYVSFRTLKPLLDSVSEHKIDVGMAGITITSTREKKMDFSHSYYDSGLQILINNSQNLSGMAPLYHFFKTIFSPGLLMVIGLLLFFLLIAAHIIWFNERKHNPVFPQSYRQGIWEAFWWAGVTVTTVGYGDKIPKGVGGRIFALFWMFAGYFILAYFTASVTTTFTVQQLRGAINGPMDLPGKKIATVKNTVAAAYLKGQGIKAKLVDKGEEAYKLLENHKVEAVVYDAPVLNYYATHHADNRVKVVGLLFKKQDYGMALQKDSPYRERINLAILKLIENGAYQKIYESWFGKLEG